MKRWRPPSVAPSFFVFFVCVVCVCVRALFCVFVGVFVRFCVVFLLGLCFDLMFFGAVVLLVLCFVLCFCAWPGYL